MNVFLDSTTLIYTADATDPAKTERALAWLSGLLRSNSATISVQVMNEFYWASSRKAHLQRVDELIIADLQRMSAFATAPLNAHTHFLAHDLRRSTNYGWRDCLLLASAQAAKCAYFLSEDLQHERRIGDLTILNPFLADPETVLGG